MKRILTRREPSVAKLLIVSMAAIALVSIPSSIRSAGAKVVGPPEVAWKDLTFNQKRAYMKSAVMPKMKTVFQTFDGDKFAKFTCETCHGKNAADRKYKMPSPDIHPLPSTPEAFQAKLKTEPTWPKFTKFMSQDVEPAMGTLLAVAVFDPKKPVEGALSCKACHKLEGPTR
jgi:hypothetical protein